MINPTSLEILNEDECTGNENGKKHRRNKIAKFLDNDKQLSNESSKECCLKPKFSPITVFDTTNVFTGNPKPQTISTTIPLHQIAYSVAIPSNPHVLVITSKQNVYLCCRVFYFNKPEKATAATLQLAKHFQRLYQEWNNKRKVYANTKKDVNQNNIVYSSNSSLNSSSSSDSLNSQKRFHSSCENIFHASSRDNTPIRPRTSSEGQKFKFDRNKLLKLAAMRNAKHRSSSESENDSVSSSSTSPGPVTHKLKKQHQMSSSVPTNGSYLKRIEESTVVSLNFKKKSLNREFKRRQSCSENPDELPLGAGVTLNSLEEKLEDVNIHDSSSSSEDLTTTKYVFAKM